jgi:hypothetical protein
MLHFSVGFLFIFSIDRMKREVGKDRPLNTSKGMIEQSNLKKNLQNKLRIEDLKI